MMDLTAVGGTAQPQQQEAQQGQRPAQIQQGSGLIGDAAIRQSGKGQHHGGNRIQGEAPGPACLNGEGGQAVEAQCQEDKGQQLNIICPQGGVHGINAVGQYQPDHQR